MFKFIKKNWIIILSLIYILSPIDFIPEALLGPVGIIDDFLLVLILLTQAILNHFRIEKKARRIIEGKELK